jgi:putative transposase
MEPVERLQAYRFELIPNGEQERKMRQFAGSARYVFNRALAIQNHQRESTGRKQSGYAALCRMLTEWRNDPATAWLSEAPVHATQQALRNLEAAWARHFESLKKLGLGWIRPEEVIEAPKFKKKHPCRDSFRYPDPKQCQIEQGNNRLFLPKLGWVRYRNSRVIEGEPSNVTVCSNGGKWFVSVQTKREVDKPVHESSSMVAIDLGVVRFATLSDGEVIQPSNPLQKKKGRLKRYQRMMSRRVKYSRNWKKAKAKVNSIHRKIANIRNDFLHKTTTAISKSHAIVVIEDLKVRNMSKSAAGTKENPGSNVKQKSGLNRSILDQAWGEWSRQLAYKQEWRGGRVLAVPPHHTSQECPLCGYISPSNRKIQALFLCLNCGYTANADYVSSMNILSRGMEVLRDEGQDTAQACAGWETTARIACEVNGAVRPSAAGTLRRETPCVAP